MRITGALPPTSAFGRAFRLWPAAALCLAALAGCRVPPVPPLRDGGAVHLPTLMEAHPAWTQVAALDARLRGLEREAPAVAPIPIPEETALDAATDAFAPVQPSLGLGERRELQALIRRRVEADYEALVARLDQEVRRYEAGERAAALARAEEGIVRRTEEFRSEYLDVVRRYAELVGPLLLLQIALMPGLGDTAFYPPQVLDERGRRRRDLEEEVEQRRASMDRELAALTMAYREEVAARRVVAAREAEMAAEQYRQARLQTLVQDRERQRRALEADLQRALQEADRPPAAPISPQESVFEGRREMAGDVLAANAAARRARETAEERRMAALQALRQQRRQLAALIERATRTLAESVALEEGLRVEWAVDGGDPQVTARWLRLLRDRWAADTAAPAAPPPPAGRRA